MDNSWPTKMISIKNHLLNKYIKLKDIALKTETQITRNTEIIFQNLQIISKII